MDGERTVKAIRQAWNQSVRASSAPPDVPNSGGDWELSCSWWTDPRPCTIRDSKPLVMDCTVVLECSLSFRTYATRTLRVISSHACAKSLHSRSSSSFFLYSLSDLPVWTTALRTSYILSRYLRTSSGSRCGERSAAPCNARRYLRSVVPPASASKVLSSAMVRSISRSSYYSRL